MSHLPAGVRLAWLLVALLSSAVVALLAFILKTRTGSRAADAVLVAGSAFAGSMVVAMGLLTVALGP
ncbi:hypothetical protein [Kitasatospora sp. NPDC051914]|uniref:hypothetical protein n=1 Tax=Kitasatospora sp. NPDC051914 TaxID=3154945 RepID=UPI0034164408